jgi:hypothetical protein
VVVLVLLQGGGDSRSALLAWQKADEAETAGAACRRVDHDDRIRNHTERLEVFAQLLCRRVLRQAPNEELIGAWHSALNIHCAASDVVRQPQPRRSRCHIGKGNVAKAA